MADFNQKLKKIEHDIFVLRAKLKKFESQRKMDKDLKLFILKLVLTYTIFCLIFYLIGERNFLFLSLIPAVGIILEKVIASFIKKVFLSKNTD
jgi:hypothetical protein